MLGAWCGCYRGRGRGARYALELVDQVLDGLALRAGLDLAQRLLQRVGLGARRRRARGQSAQEQNDAHLRQRLYATRRPRTLTQSHSLAGPLTPRSASGLPGHASTYKSRSATSCPCPLTKPQWSAAAAAPSPGLARRRALPTILPSSMRTSRSA